VNVHIGAAAPIVVRRRQFEADFVLEHMRRRIHLNVQGAPPRDPHRCAVGRCGSVVLHDLLCLSILSK
jgi:hypothetical protein